MKKKLIIILYVLSLFVDVDICVYFKIYLFIFMDNDFILLCFKFVLGCKIINIGKKWYFVK